MKLEENEKYPLWNNGGVAIGKRILIKGRFLRKKLGKIQI
jgi:hypothetical protein